MKLRDSSGTHGSRCSLLEVKLKSWAVGPKLKAKIGFHDTEKIQYCYINSNEIPGELSRENMISSHVKITCYLHK